MEPDERPPPYRGATKQNVTAYNVTFSRTDTALIERQRAAWGGLGKSAFFQRLLHEAVGARLPVVTGGGK